ncbi:MAG TPA: hypothetical protein VND91_02745 [Candidatus Saccharimonadia bacterium]|nr:hypothetical protein [Candidatus Saccharimonadia bacterium]
MNQALGLMFLQGYVATPRALATVAPDLVDRIADAREASRASPAPAPAPTPSFRSDALAA